MSLEECSKERPTLMVTGEKVSEDDRNTEESYLCKGPTH